MSKKARITWEVRSDDIFPLANDAHAYWSGYFTSRPALKRQVRFASNFLNSARQMEVISGVTAADVDTPTTRPSPPVGQSWTDSMEGAIAVATHHDGMSGTERQDVSNDYSQRISEGHFEVEAGVAKSLQKMAGITEEIGHCNCNSAGNCMNMSICAYTTGPSSFKVLAWNPQGRTIRPWLRIPVTGAAWTVTDLSTKADVPNQATAVDERTSQLPLLYLNRFGMDTASVAAAEGALRNNATHIVSFEAFLPPVGYSSYSFKKATLPASLSASVAAPTVVSNGVYEIRVNEANGQVESIRNLLSGVESSLRIEWGYYVSMGPIGGCTEITNGSVTHKECSTQTSGAYLFRPALQRTLSPSLEKPQLEVTTGPLVSEIKQKFADWATHTIRLTKGSPHVEIEWTAGPIPMDHSYDELRGKELVLKVSSSINSRGVFYTDSNGREMIRRVRNGRGPSYPPLIVNEPVAGNYCA